VFAPDIQIEVSRATSAEDSAQKLENGEERGRPFESASDGGSLS
jgi:hypothetical protein